MPLDISPKKVQESVHKGFERLSNFRAARLMFLSEYVGRYYDKDKGEIGTVPLNLIYNAVRTLVPHIVMDFPKHNVSSRYLQSRDYAELLSLALNYHGKTIDLRSVYRQTIVDALFTVGIIKTGLTTSDSIYTLDDENIDAGTIYSERVDFDNFVVAPTTKGHLFVDAPYVGDRTYVARQTLLESGLYNNELIEQLPSISAEQQRQKVQNLSQKNLNPWEIYDLEDEVEIVELWVPGAKALVTVPGSKDTVFDDYLRIDDYYGPDTGPYTYLALGTPVPDNPIPVPPVSIWYDLHILANKLASKTIDQALRQKDLVAYRRAAVDDAVEVQQALDGDAVATDDPDAVRTLSFGGQQQSNEIMTAIFQNWFNMMAANPQGIGGQQLDSDSATEARILQGNANVGLEDMKNQVYAFAAQESSKRAWYMHTDPFIEIPLIRRNQVPAIYVNDPRTGIPYMAAPPQITDEQVFLTPEARRGDWLDFTFEIQPESMGRVDSDVRMRRALEFAVKIMPAALNAAQIFALLQLPFDVSAYIIRMAKENGIDWMDEVFFDPNFHIKLMQQMMLGPSPQQSQGIPMPNMMAGLLQNGQPGNVMAGLPSPDVQERQNAQAGANEAQALLK